jgi:hypothetical protein
MNNDVAAPGVLMYATLPGCLLARWCPHLKIAMLKRILVEGDAALRGIPCFGAERKMTVERIFGTVEV